MIETVPISDLCAQAVEALYQFEQVQNAKRGLTAAQRKFVKAGCIHGDFSMRTVRELKRKGLFYLHIDSPNGQWGFMRLTPLGAAVRAALA